MKLQCGFKKMTLRELFSVMTLEGFLFIIYMFSVGGVGLC